MYLILILLKLISWIFSVSINVSNVLRNMINYIL